MLVPEFKKKQKRETLDQITVAGGLEENILNPSRNESNLLTLLLDNSDTLSTLKWEQWK